MRTLLNIIWFVFGGFWLAVGYAFAGLVLCLLIITIPLGQLAGWVERKVAMQR